MARSSCTFKYAATQTRTQSLLQRCSKGEMRHYHEQELPRKQNNVDGFIQTRLIIIVAPQG